MNEFDKLKSLLENKKIIKVEDPKVSECICKFTMEDGSSFRLHATDLGFWIEETVSNNNEYQSLNSLMNDINKLSDSYNQEKAEIIKFNNKFIFSLLNKDYIIDEKNLSEKEKFILNSDIGKNILIDAIETGPFWKSRFSSYNDDCPEEFYIK